MVADGRPGINETLFKAQIDDLYHSLDKNDILRSINIIDSVGNTKNVLAISPLTALLDYPNELIRAHAAQALDKLKDVSVAETGYKSLNDRTEPAKVYETPLPVKTDIESVVTPVKDTAGAAGNNPQVIAPRGRENIGPKKLPTVIIAIAGIAIVMVAILVIMAGAVVYFILMPPSWSEQLQYKNSTGQFQNIINYRNATDLPYGNVSSFVASEKTQVEATIAADTMERPVEYAAYLHDMAEAQGINCSLVATEINNGYPGHVLIAFNTKDNGMLYVDPTAKNVSADDYPGIDFGKIVFMRDTWVQDAGFLDGNNKVVYMTVYRNSAPVSYSMLMSFLAGDHTEDATYVDPAYTCANFATNLLNRAEAQGIKCGLVKVSFDGQPVGHAVNAFPTTDKGIVLIDDTGLSAPQKESSLAEFQTDAVVYISEGKPLGELNLSQVDGHLDYSYFAEKMKMIEEFYDRFYQYEEDVEIHNQAVGRYDADVKDYTAALNDYNTKMAAHNAAVNQFNLEERVKYSLYQTGSITYETYSDWYNTNIVNIPAVPTNEAQLDGWKARLNDDRSRLNNEMRALNERFDIIWNSEGRKWAVYSYWQPPDGVVNKIEYVW